MVLFGRTCPFPVSCFPAPESFTAPERCLVAVMRACHSIRFWPFPKRLGNLAHSLTRGMEPALSRDWRFMMLTASNPARSTVVHPLYSRCSPHRSFHDSPIRKTHPSNYDGGFDCQKNYCSPVHRCYSRSLRIIGATAYPLQPRLIITFMIHLTLTTLA